MIFTSAFAAVALLAAEAAAHGAVTSYVIAGKKYEGYVLSSFRPPKIKRTQTNTPQIPRLLPLQLQDRHPAPMVLVRPRYQRR